MLIGEESEGIAAGEKKKKGKEKMMQNVFVYRKQRAEEAYQWCADEKRPGKVTKGARLWPAEDRESHL